MPSRARRNIFDGLRFVRRMVGPVERFQARRWGKTVLSVLFRTPVVMVHTVGRRSGQERTTLVAAYTEPDGTLLTVGGAGGQARTPDWVANLRANASGAVTIGRMRHAMTAEELAGGARAEAWTRLRLIWPRIETYERRAGHPIPVLRLHVDHEPQESTPGLEQGDLS